MTRIERWLPLVVALVACGDEAPMGPSAPGSLEVFAEPSGRDFVDAVVVQLSADRPSDIIYTLDGSLPSAERSRSYSGPIRLTASTLLTFMAVHADGSRSELATEWYTRAETPLPRVELPPRSLRVVPDRLVFTPEPGIQSETKVVRLESIGTEPVTVFAMSTRPTGGTTNDYDPGVFRIVPSTTDPVIVPGESVELTVTYFTTRTARSLRLDIETDAENVDRGIHPLLLFGRMFP